MKVWVEGLNLNKLISKLNDAKIRLFNCKKGENKIEFLVKKQEEQVCLKILNSNKYVYKVEKFTFKKLIKRFYGVFVGIFLMFIILSFYNVRIYQIKIYGAKDLTKDIEQVLKENNIKPFMYKNIDKAKLENVILTNFKQVSELSYQIVGTTLILNINLKQVQNDTKYEPIVANFTGVIESFNLLSGSIAVKVGDFVNYGDILVYPYILDADGKQVSVQPICNIKAKATKVKTIKTYESTVEIYETGNRQTSYKIYLLNTLISQKSLKKEFAFYKVSCYTENISSILTLKRVNMVYSELKTRIKYNDLDAIKDYMQDECMAQALNELEENVEILSKDTNSIILEGVLYSTATVNYFVHI